MKKRQNRAYFKPQQFQQLPKRCTETTHRTAFSKNNMNPMVYHSVCCKKNLVAGSTLVEMSSIFLFLNFSRPESPWGQDWPSGQDHGSGSRMSYWQRSSQFCFPNMLFRKPWPGRVPESQCMETQQHTNTHSAPTTKLQKT